MSTGIRSGACVIGRVVPWSIPVVAPSAPGNRPKRLSNVRFSLMMNTTCLMGHRVVNEVASMRAGRVPRSLGGKGFQSGRPLEHAVATSNSVAESTPADLDPLPGRRGSPRIRGTYLMAWPLRAPAWRTARGTGSEEGRVGREAVGRSRTRLAGHRGRELPRARRGVDAAGRRWPDPGVPRSGG